MECQYRTDKNGDEVVNNYWMYEGCLIGKDGKSPYDIAVDNGFVGTEQDWLKTLVGSSTLSEVVYDKPNLMDDSTQLSVWYYYQAGENAWLYKGMVPTEKDYPPNKYAYFNGINYWNFETTSVTGGYVTCFGKICD